VTINERLRFESSARILVAAYNKPPESKKTDLVWARRFLDLSENGPISSCGAEFRSPRILEVGLRGDKRRFLCIMEIRKGEIAGAFFELNALDGFGSLQFARGLRNAWMRCCERVENAEFLPEGASLEELT
jgi:hypothetical protein